MHATIRRYEGVAADGADERGRKATATLVPPHRRLHTVVAQANGVSAGEATEDETGEGLSQALPRTSKRGA